MNKEYTTIPWDEVRIGQQFATALLHHEVDRLYWTKLDANHYGPDESWKEEYIEGRFPIGCVVRKEDTKLPEDLIKAIYTSGYALTNRERALAEWFFNAGKGSK